MSKFLITLCLIIVLFVPLVVFAQYGLEETAKEAGITTETSVEVLIGKIIGAALGLVGIIFFGLMLYGGFLWMTARGETKTVEKAKDTIIAASIGLVIILAAYAITHFVIKALT